MTSHGRSIALLPAAQVLPLTNGIALLFFAGSVFQAHAS